jgi:hypothetical protein
MTLRLIPLRSSRLLCLSVLALGCTDAGAPVAVASPPQFSLPVTRLQGEVDLVAGTLTFDVVRSTSPGAAGAVRFATYGEQGITVRLYNTPVTRVAGSGGFATYSADVGIRNLLPFPVGDEEGKAAPSDTLGLFVYFIGEPVVRLPIPCAACTVRIANAHGAAPFDTPAPQWFFYWRDRLDAAGGIRDTTLVRQRWQFDASSAVTAFTFEVLVRAAWPGGEEPGWTVSLDGDSLPGQARPRWQSQITGGNARAEAGLIELTAANGTLQYYYRADSLERDDDATIEARVSLVRRRASSLPQGGLYLDDGTRLVTIGISHEAVGFTNGSVSEFLPGTTYAMNTETAHTYAVRKFGSDSVQLWVDGIRRLAAQYNAFDPATARTLPRGIGMLTRGNGSATSRSWDRVSYQLGALSLLP